MVEDFLRHAPPDHVYGVVADTAEAFFAVESETDELEGKHTTVTPAKDVSDK